MKEREYRRLGEKILRKVLKYWQKHDPKVRHNFDAGLLIIIKQVAKHCKLPPEAVGKHTSAVIGDFIAEYKEKTPPDLRGVGTMVPLLYFLYLKHLGKI